MFLYMYIYMKYNDITPNMMISLNNMIQRLYYELDIINVGSIFMFLSNY